MPDESAITTRLLLPGDVDLFRGMLALFGRVFDEADTYVDSQPRDGYIEALLAGDQLIAVVGLMGDEVVGALAAYELKKFEQERSEIFIYDLAVDDAQRRRGMATAMIRQVQAIAKERGAHVIFIQADYGNEPAIALYTKLGVREEVLHFDIEPG